MYKSDLNRKDLNKISEVSVVRINMLYIYIYMFLFFGACSHEMWIILFHSFDDPFTQIFPLSIDARHLERTLLMRTLCDARDTVLNHKPHTHTHAYTNIAKNKKFSKKRQTLTFFYELILFIDLIEIVWFRNPCLFHT